MIRLVALASGLLCGTGFILSGLHDPALLHASMIPQDTWSFLLGLGLLFAMVVASLIIFLSGKRDAPLLGADFEPLPGGTGWKPMVGALLFGIGWGLAGYVPLTALASAGALSPGSTIFLASVIGGMIMNDVLAGGNGPKSGRRGSFG